MANPELSTRSILAGTELLQSLSPRWLDVLAAEAKLVRIPRGKTIFREGEPCPGLYCVGSGQVRVFKLSPSGKELVLHFAGAGKTFAEVAVLGDFPAPANAEAVEDSLCALVPAEQFRRLLQTHHELCLQLLGGLSFWVHHLISLLEDVVLRDAAGRVARHLLTADPSGGRQPFQLRVLKKDLAAHLNLTSETLSRTLRRLEQQGLIELGQNQQIRLLDPGLLEEAAGGVWE